MIDRLEIHAYADGELPAEDRARLESEISASPEARKELDAIQGVKICLKSKVEVHECSAMWRGCTARLDDLDRVKKAELFVGKYAWALCGVLFLVIAGGGLMNRYRGGTVSTGTVASDLSGMVSVQTPRMSHPEQLRSWITDQTGQDTAINVNPARIVGMGYSDQPEGRVVEFKMQDNIGFVELVIIPNVNHVDGVTPIGNGMYGGQISGRNCVTWGDHGSAVLLIGERDHDQLKAFGQSLYR